jgi:outer membrane protein assembly factor BamB
MFPGRTATRHGMKLNVQFAIGASLFLSAAALTAAPVQGWLAWRGPTQNGVSLETGLPTSLDPAKPLWEVDFPGASTAVVANGRLYIVGYLGEGPDLQEGIGCYDAATGKLIWQQLFSDFLSDIIYNRYATSSPAVDPETGNVYLQGTQGLLVAFDRDGKILWKHALGEMIGRLTFPNGRTTPPAVDGDLVIIHGITANWGAQGPGGDRLYAFNKTTGDLVWGSTPGDRPKDSSFSYPYIGWWKGIRTLYATLGDGSVGAINSLTGDPIWRVNLGKAGINATVLVHNDDKVVGIYGTPYEPGQMVCFKIPDVAYKVGQSAPTVVERKDVELWSRDISTSTSSPILVGDRIYVVAEKGDLICVDITTGKTIWETKIGIEQRNSCPLYAGGKLYVPILDDPDSKGGDSSEAGSKGGFYVVDPADGKVLTHVALDGRCFGSPTAYNGKVYIQTTKHLYAFGSAADNPGLPKPVEDKPWPKPGAGVALQIVPSEVLLHPGEKVDFTVRTIDAHGLPVETVKSGVQWASFIPPTAKVKAKMNGEFIASGELVASAEKVPSAGAYQAVYKGLKGTIRGRVLPFPPITENFEEYDLSETSTFDQAKFSYPPLPWIGARFKFDIREQDGSKVLRKTIDNRFFQRATVIIGDETMKNYTIQADVLSEGNRRKMSEVGLICQRYLITLKGNEQKIEISSNLERLRVPEKSAPSNFKWSPNTWYTLKARVDVAADGSGMIRAKVWKRGDPEPEAWTLEVAHRHAHSEGSPGLYGFSPQDMPVCIDNIMVTPN